MGDAEAGQLAMQHGASAQVKRLGQQLMNDQTGESDALQQIAQQENLTLPAEPSMMQQAQTRRLNTLYGPDFDKAFVDTQVAQDAQEIAMFQKEARSGHDPALKGYAQETLPALRRHLALVQSINTETAADEGTWHGQD
jgi:putative membrane protein